MQKKEYKPLTKDTLTQQQTNSACPNRSQHEYIIKYYKGASLWKAKREILRKIGLKAMQINLLHAFLQ